MENILNESEIAKMKQCGKLLAEVMTLVKQGLVPGRSTAEIDQLAEDALRARGVGAAFKNYMTPDGVRYPAATCISINNQIVHGLPRPDREIVWGDIVSVDIGARCGSICVDMARTFGVGDIPGQADLLIKAAEACLAAGIAQAHAGNRIGDIGAAIQSVAENAGFGIVRDLAGHGIGRAIHLPPQIPNFGQPGVGPAIVEGMALAIEPMLVLGDYRIKIESDGWTVATADNSLSAHVEDTVVVLAGKPVNVTGP